MRSKWKGPFLKYVWMKVPGKKTDKISIWKKSSILLPKMFKKTIYYHTGKKYLPLKLL